MSVVERGESEHFRNLGVQCFLISSTHILTVLSLKDKTSFIFNRRSLKSFRKKKFQQCSSFAEQIVVYGTERTVITVLSGHKCVKKNKTWRSRTNISVYSQ